MLDTAGITPVLNTIQSLSMSQLCLLDHQLATALFQLSGIIEYPNTPCAALLLTASIISGAVLKSISATHIGSSFSATSHFKDCVLVLSIGVSKSYLSVHSIALSLHHYYSDIFYLFCHLTSPLVIIGYLISSVPSRFSLCISTAVI